MEISDLPHYTVYKHLIHDGCVVAIGYDCETTELDWKFNHITEMAMLTQTIDGQEIDSQSFKSKAPERILTSPEAAIITRKHVDEIYDPALDPPSILTGKMKEYLDQAGQRLWDHLGNILHEILGDDPDLEQIIQTKKAQQGNTKKLEYRIIPFQDSDGHLIRDVRLHAGAKKISYRSDKRNYDYVDVNEDNENLIPPTYWKEQKVRSTNYSFNGLSFDNRVWAAHNYRANFPGVDVYYPESKQNNNLSVDIRTIFNVVHFCATDGETRPLIGKIYEAKTNRLRQSAKLEKIMAVNQRLHDTGVNIPAGPLVADATRPNKRRGHQDPLYDIRMMNGMLAYCRHHYPDLVAHVEQSANLDYFRDFATNDVEYSPLSSRPMHTSYPLRAIVVSTWTDNEKIYDIRPVIVLGIDEQHGRRKKLICVRADIDFQQYRYHGKKFDELSPQDIADMMEAQRGQPDAMFYEVHLKKNKGMVPIEWALAGGMTPHLTIGDYRACRNNFIADQKNIDTVMEGYRLHHPHRIERDNVPLPLAEQDIHLTYGDIKYGVVELADGKTVFLPEMIQAMAQTTYDHLVNQILRTVKQILMPHPVDWRLDPNQLDTDHTKFLSQLKVAEDYLDHRKKIIRKLKMYQTDHDDPIRLADPTHSSHPLCDHFEKMEVTEENYKYMRLLHLYDRITIKQQLNKIKDPTQSFEVQIQKTDSLSGKKKWQRLPFTELAKMKSDHLTQLKNDRRIRIEFEDNPNQPTYTFLIRMLVEEGFGQMLSPDEQQHYMDEIAIYAHGYPFIKNPENQPSLTIDRVMDQIESLRQNYSVARPKLISRAGELGIYNALAEDVDAADEIIHGIEHHTHDISKNHPLDPRVMEKFGLHPVDGTAIPHIKYVIDPEDSVTFTLPGKHIDHPVNSDQFGHCCIVLGGDPKTIAEKIAAKANILLQESGTGRLFHASDPVIYPLPDRVSRYDNFYANVDQGYVSSGMNRPKNGLVLSCGEINPVAVNPLRTADRELGVQTLRIPQRSLMALKNPRLVNFGRDDPLNGLALRKYDLSVRTNMPVRLRGIDDQGKLTGWEIHAHVTDHETWDLDDIKRRCSSGAMDDDFAYQYGFNNVSHLKAQVASWFGAFNEDRRYPDTDVLFIQLAPVNNPIQYNPIYPPRAAFDVDLDQILKLGQDLDGVPAPPKIL